MGHIASAAPDRALALESREALLVTILFADGLALCDRNDLGDRSIAIIHHYRAARANVIEIAREAVTKFRDFGFFHGLPILAKLALSDYGANPGADLTRRARSALGASD
jgi:hypothetical protein